VCVFCLVVDFRPRYGVIGVRLYRVSMYNRATELGKNRPKRSAKARFIQLGNLFSALPPERSCHGDGFAIVRLPNLK
jgi:hypothetical protein